MSTPMNERSEQRARHYMISVQGALDQSWSEWFGGLALSVEVDQDGLLITRLSGVLPDQGALRGILNRLWDLNLTLLSVSCEQIIMEAKK